MSQGYNSIAALESPQDTPADVPCAEATVHDRFDAFSREQHPCLLQFLRLRLANEEDARDLAQESLARLLRYRDNEPDSAWRPLLFRIARNLINEQYRRSQSRHLNEHVPVETLELPDPSPPPELALVQDEQQNWLREAVLQLPPRCRQVFVLARVDGLPQAQIARRCGISVKMVEKHLAKALAVLCEKAGIWDVDASA